MQDGGVAPTLPRGTTAQRFCPTAITGAVTRAIVAAITSAVSRAITGAITATVLARSTRVIECPRHNVGEESYSIVQTPSLSMSSASHIGQNSLGVPPDIQGLWPKRLRRWMKTTCLW